MEIILNKNIVFNPEICGGKPTIKGTRITVTSAMGFILAGDLDNDVLEGFPRLTKDDLQSCKEFTYNLLDRTSSIIPSRMQYKYYNF